MGKIARVVTSRTFQPLVKAFVELARRAWSDQLVSVVLYGSVARGTPTATSDVDVLLVIREAPSAYWKRLQPLVPVLLQLRQHPSWRALEARGLSPSMNVLILSPAEARERRPLYLDMVDEARLLLDRDRFFARRLSAFKARMRAWGTRKIRHNGAWYWDLKPDLRLGEALKL